MAEMIGDLEELEGFLDGRSKVATYIWMAMTNNVDL